MLTSTGAGCRDGRQQQPAGYRETRTQRCFEYRSAWNWARRRRCGRSGTKTQALVGPSSTSSDLQIGAFCFPNLCHTSARLAWAKLDEHSSLAVLGGSMRGAAVQLTHDTHRRAVRAASCFASRGDLARVHVETCSAVHALLVAVDHSTHSCSAYTDTDTSLTTNMHKIAPISE